MRLNGNVAFSACSLRFSIADSRRNGEKMQDGLRAAIRCKLYRRPLATDGGLKRLVSAKDSVKVLMIERCRQSIHTSL